MNIYETIMADIKSAMIDKNNTKRDCLRAIVSEIKNQTVNAGKELTDEICIKVIQKSAKQHNDSIDSFKLGKREDLALKEMEELKYIETYLPKMASEDETRQIIEAIINSGIEPTKKNMGLFMKSFNQNVDRKIAVKILNGILK